MDSNPGDHQPSGATDLQRPLNGASGPRQRRYQQPHDVHPVELTALTGRLSRPEAGFPLSNAVRGYAVSRSSKESVLGKGSIIPRRHPVEVRIGRVITNAELHALADNAEGTGAYRKLADAMRAAVLALGERMPTSSAAMRSKRKHVAHDDDGGGAALVAEEAAQPAGDATDERRTANRPRRASARAGRRAKG